MAGHDPPAAGWFYWLEQKQREHGDPTLPPWWQSEILRFIRSRKTIFAVAAGLRSIKSGASTTRALSAILMRPRKAVMGAPFVFPIMAAGKPEAGGRVLVIRHILREVLGWTERERKGKGSGADSTDIVRPGEYLYSYSEHTGDGIFIFRDVDGNIIHVITKVAALAGVREYTGCGGLIDEADHIPLVAEGGGAHDILDYMLARLTGQPGATLDVVSNPTHPKALLSSICGAGDGPQTHIARLGELGAKVDGEARAMFREHLLSIGETELAADKRLLEPADPFSWRIPTWVGNPERGNILECWKLAGEAATRRGELDRLGTLFRIYGARSVGGEGASRINRQSLQRCLVPASTFPPWASDLYQASLDL